MTVIFQKPYSYSLYEYDGEWYVTYLSGGPLETGVSIRLTPEEVELVRSSQSNLEELIKQFKSDSSLYDGRRVVPVVTSKGPPSSE